LAALEAVDGWPLLIVSPPSGVWAWYRLVRLFGRALSVRDDAAEARLVTYADLALGARMTPTPAIIFDDLSGPEASAPGARAGLRRLDGYSQALRVGVCSSWPEDLAQACEVMDVIRPGEFRLAGNPLAIRYPQPCERRAAEHVGAYLFTRHGSDPGSELSPRFRHSQVRTVTPSEAEIEHHEAAHSRHLSGEDPLGVLAEVLEVISAGPPQRLSRKVGAALTLAHQAAARSRRVLILTNQERTARVIRLGLSRVPVQGCSGDEVADRLIEPGHALVVLWQGSLPQDLPDADEVVICDYPWNFAEIDQALGTAAGPGPALISVLHAPGTVDDRLAMYAATRAEEDPEALSDSAPSSDMARWLLRPRGL
jgi:hypothetical protein